jgi:hypothetical protein
MTGPSAAIAQSLTEFRRTFPDEKSSVTYLFRQRWPDGFVCPGCGSRRYASLESRAYTYECLGCRRQTSITAGTLLHRSKLSLIVWFGAIHLFAALPEEMSAAELKRSLGIKSSSASRLMRKLGRLIIPTVRDALEGTVAVSHTEVVLRSGYRLTIVAALELDTDRIRLATIRDDSAVAIEAFVYGKTSSAEKRY